MFPRPALQMRVLFVSPDLAGNDATARELARTLGDDVRVDACASVRDAQARLDATPYDAVVVDVALTGRNGLQLTAEVRARSVAAPIVVLTRPSMEDEVAMGLVAGADDCVVKRPNWTTALVAALGRAAERRSTEAAREGRDGATPSRAGRAGRVTAVPAAAAGDSAGSLPGTRASAASSPLAHDTDIEHLRGIVQRERRARLEAEAALGHATAAHRAERDTWEASLRPLEQHARPKPSAAAPPRPHGRVEEALAEAEARYVELLEERRADARQLEAATAQLATLRASLEQAAAEHARLERELADSRRAHRALAADHEARAETATGLAARVGALEELVASLEGARDALEARARAAEARADSAAPDAGGASRARPPDSRTAGYQACDAAWVTPLFDVASCVTSIGGVLASADDGLARLFGVPADRLAPGTSLPLLADSSVLADAWSAIRDAPVGTGATPERQGPDALASARPVIVLETCVAGPDRMRWVRGVGLPSTQPAGSGPGDTGDATPGIQWLFADVTAGHPRGRGARAVAHLDALRAAVSQLGDWTCLPDADEEGAVLLRQLRALVASAGAPAPATDLVASVQSALPHVRALWPDVEVAAVSHARGPVLVCAGPSEVHGVVLDLAAAAREALPIGGSVRLETGPATCVATGAHGHRLVRSVARLRAVVHGLGARDVVVTESLRISVERLEGAVTVLSAPGRKGLEIGLPLVLDVAAVSCGG